VPEDLYDEPERRAAAKNLEARKFISRGKLREALDALNLAIQLAPSSPEPFLSRAEVFERMGMPAQAEADRARAGRLAAALPLPPPPVSAEAPRAAAIEEPEAEEETVAAGDDAFAATPAMYVPDPHAIPRERGRSAGCGIGVLTMFAFLLLIAGLLGGLTFAVTSIDFGSLNPFKDDPFSPTATPFASGAAGGSGSATATLEPTVRPDASTTGSPYSLSGLQSAWEGKGFTVKPGAGGEGYSGFKTVPVDVTLTKGTSAATASVFVYKSREAALAEWDLVPGSRPSPKGNRTLSANVSAWWNANVVVVLRTDPAGLGPEALEGLLALGG
jgi:hypothetical protein